MKCKKEMILAAFLAASMIWEMGTADAGWTVFAEETQTEESVESAAEAVKPQMTYEEYPRIDGSLACVPLCEALAVEITGCTDAQAEETMVDFTNTNPCYIQLAEGKTDILLAYEPADSTKEELEK